MILAGDIGGTKSRLALFDVEKGKLTQNELASFVSKDFGSLPDIISRFLQGRENQVDSVCLGVPGAVRAGKVFMTNLGWHLSEKELKSLLKVNNVRLVNDLVATASAITHLSPSEIITLHEGTQKRSRQATFAVLAPGTGLGQAFLTWNEGKPCPHPSEGGHVDFAPTDPVQIELLKYLQKKYDRVSYERILSGPGLVNIYDFLKDTERAVETAELEARFHDNDPAAVITSAALRKEFEICEQALDLFVKVLGAQAANLVLGLLALGGVYLGGGIPPKIAEKLTDGLLVQAYLKKGLMTRLVEATPLYLIKNDHAALIGAAHLAVER